MYAYALPSLGPSNCVRCAFVKMKMHGAVSNGGHRLRAGGAQGHAAAHCATPASKNQQWVASTMDPQAALHRSCRAKSLGCPVACLLVPGYASMAERLLCGQGQFRLHLGRQDAWRRSTTRRSTLVRQTVRQAPFCFSFAQCTEDGLDY